MPRRSQVTKMPGREMRGFRFRAYPTGEQEQRLALIEVSLKRCWNWLCARAEDVRHAREAYAQRYHGITKPEPMPAEPPPTDEMRRKRTEDLRAYYAAVRAACKDVPEVSYRSVQDWMAHFGCGQDYQIFRYALDWGPDDPPLPGAYLLQSICVDYSAALSAVKRGQRPPQFRRRWDHISVRSRTDLPLHMGASGSRPGAHKPGRPDWLNAYATIPGVGRVGCRIGRKQLPRLEHADYWVCGISLCREPDGWYAAIRQHVIVKKPTTKLSSPESRWAGYGLPKGTTSPPLPKPGEKPGPLDRVIGLDVGLTNLVALSAGVTGPELLAGNPRSAETLERIAGRQAAGLPAGKMISQLARRTRHMLRGVLAWIREYQPTLIAIEDNKGPGPTEPERAKPKQHIAGFVAKDGRGRTTKEGGYTPGAGWLLTELKKEYKVTEVDRRNSSLECSRCGAMGKSSWISKDRVYRCKKCDTTVDRDINAARVIRIRALAP